MHVFIFCVKCGKFAKYSLEKQCYLNHFTPAGRKCTYRSVVSFSFSTVYENGGFHIDKYRNTKGVNYCPRCGSRLNKLDPSIIPDHLVNGEVCSGAMVRVSKKMRTCDNYCIEVLKQARRYTSSIIGPWDYLGEIDIIEKCPDGKNLWKISCPACGLGTYFDPVQGVIFKHCQPKTGQECESSEREYYEGRFYRNSKTQYVRLNADEPSGSSRQISKYTFDQTVSVRPIYTGLPGSKRRR